MCGIFGYASLFNFDVSEINSCMSKHILNRGPDNLSFHYYDVPNLLLGHSRLAINDLSSNGNQPYSSSSGRYKFVFNGEIYNFRFLKSYLDNISGISFKSSSDTEVIAHLFDHFGIEKTFSLFDSMHSIAVFDTYKNILILSVDACREKPLYYAYKSNESIAFSSSIYSLLELSGNSASLCKKNILEYLSYGFVPSPNTPFKNIYKILPGTYLTINLSDLTFRSHPFPDVAQKNYPGPLLNFKDAKSQLENILIRSCDTRLTASVPTSLLLSGGVDSSLICALATSKLNIPVDTFSIGFSQEANENLFANSVANYFGTNHTSIQCNSQDICSAFDSLPAICDDLISDPSLLPSALIYRSIPDYKVFLTGDGADEFFGGYNRYSYFSPSLSTFSLRILSKLLDTFPAFSSSIDSFGNLLSIYNMSQRIRGLSSVDYTSYCNYYFSNLSRVPPTFLQYFSTSYDPVFDDLEVNTSLSSFRFLMLLDQLSYLPDNILVKSDKASMFSSKEVRSIFLSPEVRAFASCLDDKYIKPHIIHGTKPLLRALLSDYLPPKFFQRPKMGFTFGMQSIAQSLGTPLLRSLINEKILYDIFGESFTSILDHLINVTEPNSQLDRFSWNLFVLFNYCDKLKSFSIS